MIEEYPVTSPNHNAASDTQDKLNMGLARQISQLALASISSLAGFEK